MERELQKAVRATLTLMALSAWSLLGACADAVNPAPPVASLTISPRTTTLITQASVKLTATAREADGNVLAGRHIAWSSERPGVAEVDASGLVTAVSAGATRVIAMSESASDTAIVYVVQAYRCEFTPDGTIVC